ncbi:dual specificity protein phosphatase 3-like [Centruroides vittatus]|uniref:dual specificity protein phosphatase 3-like n=1 Tax=Centruroides vittatus TaxID=120091 RepID=UPI0035103C67
MADSKLSPICSPSELISILKFPTGRYEFPEDPYNEVYENILLGNGETAFNRPLLRRLNVTHVVNAACGTDPELNLIDTSAEFYKDVNIDFYGIYALDMSSFPLHQFFNPVAEYIHDALQSGGRVFVHCRQGISRSATLVLAYLMIKKNMTAQEATRLVRSRREITPNEGFLYQICDLNERLHSK